MRRQPHMRQQIHRLVFLDETGTTTKMTHLRGRARRGGRLKATAPFGHWATQTFIAGLRCDGLVAPWVIDHPMNRETFDIYVETQLAPTLQKGDVVNLSQCRRPARRHQILPRPAQRQSQTVQLDWTKSADQILASIERFCLRNIPSTNKQANF